MQTPEQTPFRNTPPQIAGKNWQKQRESEGHLSAVKTNVL